MSKNFWDEVFGLVDEYDAKRAKVIKEYRLYYDEVGNIIGLWETGHPENNNFIVLDDPSVFYHNNTSLLKVKNKKLVVLDPQAPQRIRLQKGRSECRVVQGHAALLLEPNENFEKIEYYDRTNY
jgi:hypothetical protein